MEFSNGIQAADLTDPMICKEILQLPFSHIENLVSQSSEDLQL
jgi:hypothetical protein